MKSVDVQWLATEETFKQAVQGLLGCSGQLLKKYFTSTELKQKIHAKDLSRLPLDLVNHLQVNPVYDGPEVKILSETNNYLAIHKPASIHSHPLKYSDTNTVLNYLASIDHFQCLTVNAENYDRGLLYRLDYETSGVLLLAKNPTLFLELRHNFETQMKRKIYFAVVEGEFNRDGIHSHHFKGAGEKGSKQKVSEKPMLDSREGVFNVKTILKMNNKSLLMIEHKTGLRHQIRSQLSHLGFPILGDELYGGNKAERLFLHAWRYEWSEFVEDNHMDLFDRFFDLNRAFQMCHDMLGVLKSR
jgi:23S rRNA pseudouridine1911/1915/1917 synthase